MSGFILAASSVSAMLIDIGTLKSDVSACKMSFNTDAATCATIDGDLFVGNSSGVVCKFDRKGSLVGTVYSGSEPIVALAVKDIRTLVVAVTNSVRIVNTINSEIIGVLLSAIGTIKSISLSHDKELLSIATESGIDIYNLSNNTSVALNLRALPPTLGTTVFHPSRRSSLVACCGSQLITFDVTKPGAPFKITSLGSHSRVVDFTFLPSGKNVLAVALDNGHVLIVDLDKEKAITKRIELKKRLSTVAISTDNTLIFIGTAVGDILVHDARFPERAICTIPIGTSDSIIALAAQRHSVQPRGTKTSSKPPSSVVTAARALPLGDKNTQKVIKTTQKGTLEATPVTKDIKVRAKASAAAVCPMGTRNPISRAASVGSESVTASPSATTPVKLSKPVRFAPTSPSVTRQVPRRITSIPSPASSPSSAARPRKSDERSSSSSQRADRRVSPEYSKTTTERTPSPDLLSVGDASMAYEGRHIDVPPEKDFTEEANTALGMAPTIAIDLSTPPKAPMSRPKGHGRIDSRASDSPMYDSPVYLTSDGRHGTSTPPRRKFGPNGKAFAPGVMQVSPMRSPAARLSMPTSTEAQEFLRNVVRDAMLEREEEQREELRALHLDMVKMGRAWKNELRTLMQEYVGDFNAIRLDNERLRAENERLRRGY